MATAWLAHCHSCRRVYGTLHSLRHTVQYNMLCVTVVQCNKEDFEYGNQYGIRKISCKKRQKIFRIWFPGISLLSKLRMSESWRWSFPAPTLICINLCCMLCADMWGYKFCRGSGFGFNWSSCAVGSIMCPFARFLSGSLKGRSWNLVSKCTLTCHGDWILVSVTKRTSSVEWIDYVNRMGSKRKVSQVFNNNPQGSRLRGQPKNRWWNCVQILITAKLKTGKRYKKRADWVKSIMEAKVRFGL